MKQFFSSPGKLVIPLIAIGLVAFLVFSLTNKSHAPDVTFTTLEGKTITTASLKDQVVLVNFWATDCPGCIAEMPDLIKTYNQYHNKGLEVIAVAMSYDPPDHVLNYKQKNALPFPVMHDGFGDIASKFNDVRVTPTTFILDKQGRVIQHLIGELDFVALHKLLDEQLANPAATKRII
jgi:peroxiredoxin